MSKDTRKNMKGADNKKNINGRTPGNLETQGGQSAMRRISKTRQAKMWGEEARSILEFGMKLTLIPTVVVECAQPFFYGKNVAAGRSNGLATWIATRSGQAKDNPSDLSVLSKTGKPEKEEQREATDPETKKSITEGLASKEIQTGESPSGIVPKLFLPDSEEGQQRAPKTITPFTVSSDGPDNVVQAVLSLGGASLNPADGGNKLFPVSESASVSKPMIAFTFDDGPYYNTDSGVLDTFQAYGDRVTFFIVGSRVNDYKDTLERIRDSGSGIGNYTFSHKNLKRTSSEEMTSQIEMINDAVETVTGFQPKLIRMPYNTFKGQVPGLVSCPVTQWGIDMQDWPSEDKNTTVAPMLSQAGNGSIVLIHDLYSTMTETLETAIPLLTAQGYRLATVSEMYMAKGVSLKAGQVYLSIPKE